MFFSIFDLHLYSEKKAGILLFLCDIHSTLVQNVLSLFWGKVRSSFQSCVIVFGYWAQPSCSAFLPGALYDSRLVVEAKSGPRWNLFVSVNAASGLTPPLTVLLLEEVCLGPPPPHWPSLAPVPGCRLLLQVCWLGVLIFITRRSKINLSSFSLALRLGVCGALLELRVCRPNRQQYTGLAGSNPLQQQFVVVVNGQQPGLTFQTVLNSSNMEVKRSDSIV